MPINSQHRVVALLASGLALGLLIFFCSKPIPPPPPRPAQPKPSKPLRIGVIRMQEVVEKYNRYIFATARFSEDYQPIFKQRKAAVTRSTEEMEQWLKPDHTLPLDDAAFNKILDEIAALDEQKSRAALRLETWEQVKTDLNAVLSLEIMEDITNAVRDTAQKNHFDCITDYVPISINEHDRTLSGTLKIRFRDSRLVFDNLKNRAPTLFADPALDITDSVISLVNARYADTFGAKPKADPLLTLSLTEVAQSLAEQQITFQAALAGRSGSGPTIQPLHGTCQPCGVVNLDQVYMTIMADRQYARHLQDRKKRFAELELRLKQTRYFCEYYFKALERKEPISKTTIRDLVRGHVQLVQLQRATLLARISMEAIVAQTTTSIFAEIHGQVALCANRRGIRLVVAAFGSDRAEHGIGIGPSEGMVLWHRRTPRIDLTQEVIEGLTQTYAAQTPLEGRDPDNPFDLAVSENQLLRNYLAGMEQAQEEQKAEDQRRLDAWHKYKVETLHYVRTEE